MSARFGAIFTLALGAGLPLAVEAAEICQQDSILRVTAGGAAIETQSGRTYRIEFDRRLASNWPPSSDILVCRRPADEEPDLPPIRIINRDADGSVYGWLDKG